MPSTSFRARALRRAGAARKPALADLPGLKAQTQDSSSEKPIQRFSDAGNGVHKPGSPWISGALQKTVNTQSAYNGIMLSDFQMKLLKQATAVLADALVGPSASPSLRLLVRRALRAAFLLVHAANVLVRIWALGGAVAHSDPTQGLASEVELASTVGFLLFTAAGVPASSLLLRALAATSALVADGRSLGAAAEGLSQLDLQQLDLVADAEKAVDLASASAGLLESCEDIISVAGALPQRVAKPRMAHKEEAEEELVEDSSCGNVDIGR